MSTLSEQQGEVVEVDGVKMYVPRFDLSESEPQLISGMEHMPEIEDNSLAGVDVFVN